MHRYKHKPGEPLVRDYLLRWKSGHQSIATEVVMPDGRVVQFMERLTKRRAIQQAQYQLQRHPEYFPVRD